ncbi:MAG: NoPhNBR1 gp65 [Myxococcaceae bacterium]|nr:NoPhNBR1 gp65 [Myxococcaceae bacterium]
MINVIGLDPSLTHTAGFHALGHPSALELRGFSIKSKPDKYAHGVARLQYLRDALATELDTCARELRPGTLLIEGYAYGAKCSREALGELGGVYRILAYESGWTIVVVPPSTLKLYVTGKGTAPKELMMLEVFKRWAYSAPDNNAADAHALMRLGVDYLSDRAGLTKRVQEVVTKLEPLRATAA